MCQRPVNKFVCSAKAERDQGPCLICQYKVLVLVVFTDNLATKLLDTGTDSWLSLLGLAMHIKLMTGNELHKFHGHLTFLLYYLHGIKLCSSYYGCITNYPPIQQWIMLTDSVGQEFGWAQWGQLVSALWCLELQMELKGWELELSASFFAHVWCLVGAVRWGPWLLSTLTSPCELVCASSQHGNWVLRAGIWRKGTDATVPFLWPGLGSHVASSLPGITWRKYRLQLSVGGCQSQFKMHLGVAGTGVVLMWSLFEMQSATVRVCGGWSQQSYKTEAFTFFIL